MRNPLFLSAVLYLGVCAGAWAQNVPAPQCETIQVEPKVMHPQSGAKGSITLVFKNSSAENYTIYWLNAHNRQADRPISAGDLKNLPSGFYDLLIVDKNKKGCIKQLTVTLN